MSKVSIIIPNYNNAKYLADCVKSCFNDKIIPEVIVVDDSSQDDSEIVLEKITSQATDVQVIYLEQNRGVSHARNVGIRESTGDFIITLDADDMIVPDSISQRVKIFEDNPELDIIYGSMLKIHDNMDYDTAIKKLHRLAVHPSEYTAPMYRRKVFQNFGLFYEPLRSKEDKEMSYRLGVHKKSPIERKVKIKRVDFPIYFYRRHEKSKRKRRARDMYFDVMTCMEFDKRFMQLRRGLNDENTEFLQ